MTSWDVFGNKCVGFIWGQKTAGTLLGFLCTRGGFLGFPVDPEDPVPVDTRDYVSRANTYFMTYF